MAQINFGILDTQSPAKIGNAFIRTPEQQNANMLQAMKMKHLMDQSDQTQYAISKARREDTELAEFGAGLRALGSGPSPDAIAQLFMTHPNPEMQKAGLAMMREAKATAEYNRLPPMGDATVAPVNQLAAPAALPNFTDNQYEEFQNLAEPKTSLAAPAAPAMTQESQIAQLRARWAQLSPLAQYSPQAKVEQTHIADIIKELSKPQTVAPGATLLRLGQPPFTAPETLSEFEKLLNKSGLSLKEQNALRVAKLEKDSTNMSEFLNVLSQLGKTKDRFEREQLMNRLKYLSIHASGTNVNVNLPHAENRYSGKFSEFAAEEDTKLFTAARAAPRIAENANETLRLLTLPTITGSGAEIRLALAKAYGLLGETNTQSIANTENLIRSTGAATLAAIKNSGLGTGQGFTDKDLKFLERVTGGSIALEPQTLRDFARIQHDAAVKIVAMWEARKKNIPKSALEGTGFDKDRILVEPIHGTKYSVLAPNGKTYSFSTPEKVAEFKRQAGIP